MQANIRKTLTLSSGAFRFMALTVNVMGNNMELTAEQEDLFLSRVFHIFLDAQMITNRFVTQDIKHYKLLLILLSQHNKEDLQSFFHVYLEQLETDNEAEYLNSCAMLKRMWAAVEMILETFENFNMVDIQFHNVHEIQVVFQH